jgi:hypothetical protein
LEWAWQPGLPQKIGVLILSCQIFISELFGYFFGYFFGKEQFIPVYWKLSGMCPKFINDKHDDA